MTLKGVFQQGVSRSGEGVHAAADKQLLVAPSLSLLPQHDLWMSRVTVPGTDGRVSKPGLWASDTGFRKRFAGGVWLKLLGA